MRFVLLAALLFPASALAQTTAPVPAGKLPDTVQPLAYRIDMTLVPEQERFSGHTEIDVQLKRPAASIYMHGRDLTVTRATVKIGGKEIPVTFTQKSPTGLAQVDFGKTVPAGRMTLKFDHSAAFGDGPSGIYRINVEKEWYSWSQFESIDARAAFPSFDEPGYKTPFTVSITTKPGFVALSNAPETGKATQVGNLVRHRFIATKPLPTYLIAFVTGPFVVAESMVAPTPQRKWPLPLRVVGTKPNAGQLKYALDESGKIVALLESYFNQPFPYPKLDQIGSPVMPGAMENAGADIYGDEILFVDEKDSAPRKRTFGMVVAHELSHQWFGDLVTPAWWDDIWLNESFANWMGYRIGNEWRPDLKVGLDAIEEAFEAMDLDALAAGRPIHQRITRDEDIDGAFDQITYGKGGQVVGMIADYLGDEKFRDGVRLHMKRYEYGNATTDQFFASLAASAHDPRVLASLRSFVDQQGVPVVTLRREGGSLMASQARYANFGANLPAEQWIIPFCVRRGETKSCTLLDKASQPAEAKGEGPIMPNAGGWGYYRFDMDGADWDALIAAAPGLPDGEALALDDSLWASFYAGKSNVARPVALARAMAAHPSSKIVQDNAESLAGLEQRGLIGTAALPAYRKLVSGIYGPLLAKTGFDPAAGVYKAETPDQRSERHALVQLLAVTGHDEGVRAKLIAALDAYTGGNAGALDGEYLTLAVTVALNARNEAYASGMLAKARGMGDRQLMRAVAEGMGESDNPAVANWFFTDPQATQLPTPLRSFIASAMMKSPYTRDKALDFMLANFDEFVKAGGGGGIFSGRAAQTFRVLCSLDQADKVAAKLAGQGSTLNVDRSVEAIRNCARFKDAKAAEVSAAILAM
ncbi:MAG: M1 family peptidase [Sphingomonadales bacterium]|nr:MAG: M1 family peptidase [Sphingomonadales bacterium]